MYFINVSLIISNKRNAKKQKKRDGEENDSMNHQCSRDEKLCKHLECFPVHLLCLYARLPVQPYTQTHTDT